ncbi:MAG: hypothetical protein ABL856_06180 [Gallionella sp.]
MKKLFKFIKWCTIILLGLPALVYLIWIAGNISDDDLNPALAKLVTQLPKTQLSDRDNAYFDILGLAAPNKMSPHEWGLAWFSQAIHNDQLIREGQPHLPISLDGYPSSTEKLNLPCLSNASSQSCIEEIANNPSEAKQCLREGAVLLQRFDSLLDKEYQEPYRDMMPLSDLAILSIEHQAIRLAELRFSVDVANGNNDVALTRWGNETSFILRQAKYSHSLIDKMVLTMALKRYQRLLADYISAQPKVARQQVTQIQDMLRLFKKDAVTLQPAFENEAILSAKLILSPLMSPIELSDGSEPIYKRLALFLSIPLFDRHATANSLSKIQLEYARTASLSGDDYREALAGLAAQRAQQEGEGDFLSYHNPVGHVLAQVAVAPDMTEYMYKSDEVIANAQLLLAAINLIAQNKTDEKSVSIAIKENQASLKHPFTGELPQFDTKTRSLSYPAPKDFSKNIAWPIAITL